MKPPASKLLRKYYVDHCGCGRCNRWGIFMRDKKKNVRLLYCRLDVKLLMSCVDMLNEMPYSEDEKCVVDLFYQIVDAHHYQPWNKETKLKIKAWQEKFRIKEERELAGREQLCTA